MPTSKWHRHCWRRPKIDQLDAARRLGTTLRLVTNDIDEASHLADRVWVLGSHPGASGSLAADLPLALPQPRQRDAATLAHQRNAVLHALQAVHAVHAVRAGGSQ